jgi:hypothetical protein
MTCCDLFSLSLSLTRFITAMMYVDRETSSPQASSHTRLMKIDSRGNYCLRYCGKLNGAGREELNVKQSEVAAAEECKRERERERKTIFRLFKCISICLLRVYSHPFFIVVENLFLYTHIKETRARVQRDHCVRSHTA